MGTTTIETNDRFDQLTNLDIKTHHRDTVVWVMRSDFLGAFSYWVVSQSPYETPDINKPLKAFAAHIGKVVEPVMPKSFTYDELAALVSEEALESIPEVLELNRPKISSGEAYRNRYQPSSTGQKEMNPDFDFIDLGALSRNIFYMILRSYIAEG